MSPARHFRLSVRKDGTLLPSQTPGRGRPRIVGNICVSSRCPENGESRMSVVCR